MSATRPILYYITGGSGAICAEATLSSIRAAFAAGIDWVQVREKTMPVRELCRLVEQAASLPEKGAGRLLVNDRADLALACGADGVHLPAGSLPASVIRRLAPAGWLVGVSCHTVEEVRRAAAEGASFAVLGPVFATPGKGPPLAVEILRQACASARAASTATVGQGQQRAQAGPPTPQQRFGVLALGGITVGNAPECLVAGAAGLAAIRLFQSDDLPAIVRQLRECCGSISEPLD